MSYILDALRRAEAERERGAVPGLHAQAVGAVGSAPAGRPASGGRWMVPALGVLVAAVALLGWRPWASDPTPPTTTLVPSTATIARGPTVVAPVPMPVPVQSQSPAASPPAATLRAAEGPVRRALVPTPPVAAAAKRRTIASSPAAETAVPVAASSPGDAKVYAVAELPQEVRQQLPQVTIGGSIYSASPQSRFVIVNGQLFHEGDTLAPGLVLQQIRLKSAVLAFRGYRYGITF